MSRKKTQNITNDVLNAVSNRYHLRNDKDLATHFKVKMSAISAWRTRNNYDLVLDRLELQEYIKYFDKKDENKIQEAIRLIINPTQKHNNQIEKSPAPADHAYTPADNLVHLITENNITDKTDQYIEKVRFVLHSGTRHAGSLMENIDSFYEAVQDKCDKKSMQGQIDELRTELKEIKERLPKTGE